MENDNVLKPQVIDTLYTLKDNLLKIGLSEHDLILLLQDRIRIDGLRGSKKMKRDDIKAVLDGLILLEEEMIENCEKHKKLQEYKKL